MTEEQHQHLNRIRERFTVKLEKKYTAGQMEHGGNLWENPPEWMLDQAIDEAIDLVVYLDTLKEQLYGTGV